MAKPLLNIHCLQEPLCDYPTKLRVPMDDGTVQTYVLVNKTQFQFQKVIESLNQVVGYQYKPEKRRRRNRG